MSTSIKTPIPAAQPPRQKYGSLQQIGGRAADPSQLPAPVKREIDPSINEKYRKASVLDKFEKSYFRQSGVEKPRDLSAAAAVKYQSGAPAAKDSESGRQGASYSLKRREDKVLGKIEIRGTRTPKPLPPPPRRNLMPEFDKYTNLNNVSLN